MSNKPLKKSDLNAPWMKPRKDRSFRVNPIHHLIVSEGTKTEPQYFEGLANKINGNTTFKGRHQQEFIKFHIHGAGKSPRGVFEEALEKVTELEREQRIQVEKVWVVFDKDDFREEEFNSIQELCNSRCTKEINYCALWSNECIELWFLLHFEYYNTAISREDYCPKLSTHLEAQGYAANYKKNSTDMFDFLLPHLPTAISNAEKLLALYDPQETTPSNMNPATKIHLLLNELSPYL